MTAAKAPRRSPSAVEPEPEVADQGRRSRRTPTISPSVIAQTLAGLERSSNGPVLASSIKRALLRKDPTFSEADYGFRAFGELLRHLADRNVVELTEGRPRATPRCRSRPTAARRTRSTCCGNVVADLESRGGPPQLSGLKNKLRKVQPDFSEKKYGYRGFLQFVKAAETQGFVDLEWDDDAEDYIVTATSETQP